MKTVILVIQEFALDPEFGMDDTFKSAFMRDILKVYFFSSKDFSKPQARSRFSHPAIISCLQGLQYIHKSPISYHGYLNASTCLIDINWVLKLTLYGVCNLIVDNLDSKHIRSPEHAPPISKPHCLTNDMSSSRFSVICSIRVLSTRAH